MKNLHEEQSLRQPHTALHRRSRRTAAPSTRPARTRPRQGASLRKPLETADFWPPWFRPPPQSDDPAVLADAIEGLVRERGSLSFEELEEWFGDSFAGECDLISSDGSNLVLCQGMRHEIASAIKCLSDQSRILVWFGRPVRLSVRRCRPPATPYSSAFQEEPARLATRRASCKERIE
jgi:hypothetical protein